jgi:hypothetical protein
MEVDIDDRRMLFRLGDNEVPAPELLEESERSP